MSHTALSTEEPIFVCGVPKSGTTMVGNLLANHSSAKTDYDIDISTAFLEYVIRSMKDYYFFKEQLHTPMEKANRFWNAEDHREWHLLNLRYFADLHQSHRSGSPRWGSSTTFTYIYRSLIWKWFPRATFLMVMRDPRDNWCSYKHLHVNGVKNETEKWNRFVHHHKNTIPRRDEDPRIIFIEYHEVVHNPTMVFDILGLSTPENYLNNMITVYLGRSNGDKVYSPAKELREGSPMVTSRVGRWKRDLSVEEVTRCTETFPKECEYYDNAT